MQLWASISTTFLPRRRRSLKRSRYRRKSRSRSRLWLRFVLFKGTRTFGFGYFLDRFLGLSSALQHGGFDIPIDLDLVTTMKKKLPLIPSESHEPHEPRSLQIENAYSTLNFNEEIYVLLCSTCYFSFKSLLFCTVKQTPVMEKLAPPKANLRAWLNLTKKITNYISELIANYSLRIILQWIPSHCQGMKQQIA